MVVIIYFTTCHATLVLLGVMGLAKAMAGQYLPLSTGGAAVLTWPWRQHAAETLAPATWLQAGFFILFVVAPPLDIFRYDLTLGHFIVLGMPWTLGLDALING